MNSVRSTPKKILIIRFSSLGDIILSFPLLQKLRRQYPEATIDFVTKPEYQEVVELCSIANRILVPDKGLSALRSEIRKEHYDIILDIHNNLKSRYISAYNSGSVRRIRKNHFRKFVLVNGGINLYDEIIPIYKNYLLTAKEELAQQGFAFETLELNQKEMEIPGGKYIVVAPGSKHFTKTYPAEKFAAFINTLDETKVVLVGSNAERDLRICSFIEDQCKGITNLCGKPEMRQLVFLIRNSEMVISNDSAIMHLAEALNKKVAAIFGSTVKEFGFYPQLATSKVFEQKGLQCRPCSHIGLSECPVNSFICMERTVIEKRNLELK